MYSLASIISLNSSLMFSLLLTLFQTHWTVLLLDSQGKLPPYSCSCIQLSAWLTSLPPLDLCSNIPFSMRLSLVIILFKIANYSLLISPNTPYIPSWLDFSSHHVPPTLTDVFNLFMCLLSVSFVPDPDKDVSFIKVGLFCLYSSLLYPWSSKQQLACYLYSVNLY